MSAYSRLGVRMGLGLGLQSSVVGIQSDRIRAFMRVGGHNGAGFMLGRAFADGLGELELADLSQLTEQIWCGHVVVLRGHACRSLCLWYTHTHT